MLYRISHIAVLVSVAGKINVLIFIPKQSCIVRITLLGSPGQPAVCMQAGQVNEEQQQQRCRQSF